MKTRWEKRIASGTVKETRSSRLWFGHFPISLYIFMGYRCLDWTTCLVKLDLIQVQTKMWALKLISFKWLFFLWKQKCLSLAIAQWICFWNIQNPLRETVRRLRIFQTAIIWKSAEIYHRKTHIHTHKYDFAPPATFLCQLNGVKFSIKWTAHNSCHNIYDMKNY